MLTTNTKPRLTLLDLDLLETSPFHSGRKLPKPSPSSVSKARQRGVLDSIICRPSRTSPGRYEILRHLKVWRIAQEAQLPSVPVLVFQMSDADAAELVAADIASWDVSRTQGKLDPITEAEELMQAMKSAEGPWRGRQNKVAAERGVTRASICGKLAILKLCPEVRELGRQNKLSSCHLRALISLSAKDQKRLAARAIRDQLSVENLVSLATTTKKILPTGTAPSHTVDSVPIAPSKKEEGKDPDIRRLEEAISERVGCAVHFVDRRLTIDVGGDLQVLSGVLDKLNEVSRILGCRVTFDSRDLVVDFGMLEAIDRFLAVLRVGQE